MSTASAFFTPRESTRSKCASTPALMSERSARVDSLSMIWFTDMRVEPSTLVASSSLSCMMYWKCSSGMVGVLATSFSRTSRGPAGRAEVRSVKTRSASTALPSGADLCAAAASWTQSGWVASNCSWMRFVTRCMRVMSSSDQLGQ